MRLIDADQTKFRAVELNNYAPWSLRSVLLLLDSAPTIAPPPNDPLTLDELREMDRSRWEGCPNCHRWQVYGYRNYEPAYCRDCGKPLNEPAWAELERRINDGTTDV